MFLLIGTTVYAAERLDFLGWYYGEDISDEENWYYVLKQVYHDSAKSESCDGAAIYFPAEEQEGEAWMPKDAWQMELHLPFEERIGNERVYAECGKMEKVSVSPLSVNIEWESVPEAQGGYTWFETLEIVMKGGKTLEYAEQISGKRICDETVWEFAYTSGNYGEAGKKVTSLVLAKPLDVEQIEEIRVNGKACEP